MISTNQETKKLHVHTVEHGPVSRDKFVGKASELKSHAARKGATETRVKLDVPDTSFRGFIREIFTGEVQIKKHEFADSNLVSEALYNKSISADFITKNNKGEDIATAQVRDNRKTMVISEVHDEARRQIALEKLMISLRQILKAAFVGDKTAAPQPKSQPTGQIKIPTQTSLETKTIPQQEETMSIPTLKTEEKTESKITFEKPDLHLVHSKDDAPIAASPVAAPDVTNLKLAGELAEADRGEHGIIAPRYNFLAAQTAKADDPGGRDMGAGSTGAVPAFNTSGGMSMERQSVTAAKAVAADAQAAEVENSGRLFEDSYGLGRAGQQAGSFDAPTAPGMAA